MVRSIHIKLVMIMILLILSLVTVVGAFLVNSVSAFYLNDFYTQMQMVFDDRTLVTDLSTPTEGEENPGEMISQVLGAYSGTLGIDGRNRKYYVLDGVTGLYLAGSDGTSDEDVTYSNNVLTALQRGEVGDSSSLSQEFMDLAIPLTRGEEEFVIYIVDSKVTVSALINEMVYLILEALIFAVVISILLSFLLSETMVTPLRELTSGAMLLAKGDFSKKLQVSSRDEIGTLTHAFNDMAQQLQDTLEQVEQERDKLDTLFLHMNDGVLAFSQKGWLIHSNPAAEKMLARSIDQDSSSYEGLMGQVAPFSAVLDESDCVTGEMQVGDRVLEILLAPFEGRRQHHRQGGGVLAVIRDVTVQKENEQLQREFVANVSHELRTPITNIRSYAETLKESGDDIPPEMEQKFLGVIVNESDRMTHIVQDLLTLSRFDSGYAELKCTWFSFGAAVQELYDAVFMEASRRKHKIVLNMADFLPEVWADRPRILQVMMNITSNAMKYTPDGGEITLIAGYEGEKGDGKVFLSVDDNGIGIPEEDRPRIFQRFYRVDKARSRKAGGTGLGLAIAEEIVMSHGGLLALEDKEGSGTKIRLELKVKGVVSDEKEEIPTSGTESLPSGKKKERKFTGEFTDKIRWKSGGKSERKEKAVKGERKEKSGGKSESGEAKGKSGAGKGKSPQSGKGNKGQQRDKKSSSTGEVAERPLTATDSGGKRNTDSGVTESRGTGETGVSETGSTESVKKDPDTSEDVSDRNSGLEALGTLQYGERVVISRAEDE